MSRWNKVVWEQDPVVIEGSIENDIKEAKNDDNQRGSAKTAKDKGEPDFRKVAAQHISGEQATNSRLR